jgi:predicted dehydrogenase
MMNRRDFLKTSAAGVALSTLGRVPAFASSGTPLRVGVIGVGWFGKLDTCRLIQVAPVEVISVCDADKEMANNAAELFALRQTSRKRPRIYSDFRDMLKEKDLDVCIIGTPDHWHALPMIAAVQAGADVYCQKPLSVDIAEGQAMVAAARRHGRVVQIGTQRRSSAHLIEAKNQIIESGRLGKIAFVEMNCYWHMRSPENPPDSSPPSNLDFEMWTGPAPMRPFNRLIHPKGWRAFMEYGNGLMGDMCVHMYDMARWMLGLGWPKAVSSFGGILVDKQSRANISDTQTAVFEHEELQLVWNHRTWGDAPDTDYPWACTFYGDKGTLKASYLRYDFFPAGEAKPERSGQCVIEPDKYPEDKTEVGLSPEDAVAVRSHMKNFVDSIVSRSRPVADVGEAHISTASCILANLSMRLGRTLAWDPVKGEIASDAEANTLLQRPYREPWIHPDRANT